MSSLRLSLTPARSVPIALAHLVLAACGGEPGPGVESAEEIGVVEKGAWIEGRDGGDSAVVWGKSVWVYGDTVLTQADEAGTNWHHNSFDISDDLDASDGIGGFSSPADSVGAPGYFIAPTADEQAFNDAHAGDDCAEAPCGARWAVWPGAPVFDAARDRALIPYGLIYAEPGDFNFRGVGQSFAIWEGLDEAPERPIVDASAEHPDLLFGEGEPGWGAALVAHGDDLYTFACDGSLSKPCRLARVPLETPVDRGAFRYFDGDGWSDDAGDAAELFDGAPIMSVSYCEHLGAWLAVYAPPFDHRIVARTAPDLTGPWSDESTLYTAPEEHAPYDAVHHVEYEEDGGRVQYITYSRPTSGWFGSEFALVRVVLN
ncbi:DUF4185 domain-containing protein [Sorangium sp. So ce124]|uniref:DUF4185 domain-containing protein n=1 Tax=Sorangium sp. So ce124 TaxID=3133280 RepID=UPI003F60AACF